MSIVRKITRLLYKTLKYAFILILLLLVFVIIAINTPSFQTWVAHKTADYLTDELGAKIYIGKIHFEFVKTAEIEDVFIADKNGDTLIYSKAITANFNDFNFGNKFLRLEKLELHETKAQLIKQKGSDDFNFQFLVDYFSSNDTTKSSGSPWKIEYGKLSLKHVDFLYRNENYDTARSKNINFDNLHVKNIYGELSNIKIINDNIYANVHDLECVEQSGFVLYKLSAKVRLSSTKLICKNLEIETPNSNIGGDIVFTYSHWEDYKDFISKVYMNSELKDSTKINFKDIAYFAKELNGFDKPILLKGKVTGFIKDLAGQKIEMQFANNTRFKGNFKIKGLPVINTTFFHLEVAKLSVSKNDLEKIPAYPFSENKFLKIPAELGKLGVIQYSGKYDGFINNFKTYGTFNTAIGAVTTDLSVRIDTINKIFKYQGRVKSSQFNIGKLFDINKLGNVSLDAQVKGKGLTLVKIEAELIGKINSITYNNYTYQNISINGEIKDKIFKGDLISKDVNADFDFDGKVDFRNKIPEIDFISTINKINFEQLGFIKNNKNGVLSSQILINLKGNNINNLSGQINFDNTVYKTFEKEFKLSTLDLNLDQTTEYKKIILSSNYLNLTLNGRFNLTNLPPAFNQFLNVYYPTFFEKNIGKTIYNDAFAFKLTIKKFKTLNELFLKNVMVSPNSVMDGGFDATQNLINLNLRADSIRFGSIKFNNNTIQSFSKNNKINLLCTGNNIQLSDSIKLNNYIMYLVSNSAGTKYDLEWDNKLFPNNSGRFFGRVVFENKTATINYEKIFVTTFDSTWNLSQANPTTIDSAGNIFVNPLILIKGNQMINIQGALSHRPSDKLEFNIKNFELNQLNPFITTSKLKVDGRLNGTFSLFNSFNNLAFGSDLKFDKLKLNNNDLGDGALKTEFSPQDKYLFLDGYTSLGFLNPLGEKVKNINFSGYYYLNKTEESLDINFDANPANLTLLNPFLAGIMTIKTGFVIGAGKVSGTPAKPLINAKFKINKCDLKVDYLNVVYTLAGDIEILPDQIRFAEIKMYDDDLKKNSHNGVINGNIFHNSFKDMRIDFDINFKNLLVLNTTNQEGVGFYGRVFASGNVGIFGLTDNVKISIPNIKTEKGTQFNIPMDGPAEVSENSFIRFVSKDTISVKEFEKKSGFSLDMNLKATPDAEAQIIFDAKSGDVIKAKGNGDLSLKINNLGKFDMFGEYKITNGEYLFTLENFITKKFEIESGSDIVWSGSPYNAEIDITANYKQRASIAPLFPYDSTGIYKRRYPVNCKLLMKEKLTSPDISFGVDLPTIDESTRSKIKSILFDEAELNRQVFSLLLLNSFVTPLAYSQGGGVTAGGAIASNGSEMLSNRLSGWLNGLTKQIDIGVNYRPGGALSSDELNVALSKQLLNNRLLVDGNFGVNNNKNSNSSGLIGDVNAEYKITDDGRYRIKGFNRSNDNTQITTSGGPFTQGVGIFYREEFETWGDLYKRYIKKVKSAKKKKTISEDTTTEKK